MSGGYELIFFGTIFVALLIVPFVFLMNDANEEQEEDKMNRAVAEWFEKNKVNM